MLKLRGRSLLVRNTVWMFTGHGLRLAIQAAFFAVIARSLGVNNYGSFVGVAGLVGVLYPFGAMGSGNLLIKAVTRQHGAFREEWGAAIATTCLFAAVLVGVVLALALLVLPTAVPLRLVLAVAVADILGTSIIVVSGQAFQAFEQLHWTAFINVLVSAMRLAGALVLVALYHRPTAEQWGEIYCVCTLITAAAAAVLVSWRLGLPRFVLHRSATDLREGLYFSISLSAQTIYNDIDKTMLVRLSTLSATGIYGAAYRLIDVSFSPVIALLYAAYPNFFRQGRAGMASSFSYARPLLARALGYASLVSCGILLFAGAVPYVLGGEYQLTTEALRWLAPLPVLKAIHFFLSDALTGAGYQALRSGLQAGVAIFNVLINLWIIPRYSWRGAAWSSIASDLLLSCAVGAAVLVLSRRTPPEGTEASVPG